MLPPPADPWSLIQVSTDSDDILTDSERRAQE
jgi:hypothetical protein